MLNNKHGKLLSIWWILVLAIVGTGISVGVLIFHSAGVDLRELEADALYEKINDCIVNQGILINGLIKEDFDIFEECELSKEAFGEDSSFYFNVKVFEGENLLKEIKGGDFSFQKDCEIQGENEEGKKVDAEYYPKCVHENLNTLYYKNGETEKIKIEILTASNQIGRKMSVMG